MVSGIIAAAGSSKSEMIFDPVVLQHFLSISFKCNVHFVHVAGNQMISHVTDGISRGDMYEGIMKGETMLSFLPLEKSALARSPALSKWLEGWSSTLGRKMAVLDPDGWFECGHNHNGGGINMDGVFIPRFKDGTFL